MTRKMERRQSASALDRMNRREIIFRRISADSAWLENTELFKYERTVNSFRPVRTVSDSRRRWSRNSPRFGSAGLSEILDILNGPFQLEKSFRLIKQRSSVQETVMLARDQEQVIIVGIAFQYSLVDLHRVTRASIDLHTRAVPIHGPRGCPRGSRPLNARTRRGDRRGRNSQFRGRS